MTPDVRAFLRPEWERLYLLGTSAIAARQGQAPSPETLQQLRSVQAEVEDLRARPPWRPLVADCDLSPLDQDIAACALAPEAEPRMGWLFYDLQTGASSPYPTPALIYELFAMESHEASSLESRLHCRAPLRHHRLIEWPGVDLYRPLRSTTALRARLLDGVTHHVDIIGATEIVDLGT
ncbi:MAG: ATPase, partial [Proteobacteria bacterium]|nr:ATPase [Pseudomonadota bacterium]